MVSKLHLTLGILISGFAIEGSLEGYTYLSRNYQMPYSAVIFVLGPFMTFGGLLFLWIGRLEWSELVSRRFRHAHRTFWFSILGLLLAGAPVAWFGSQSSAPIPQWVSWEFGAAVMGSLMLTYATYVLIGFELTGRPGKSLLLLAFGWATIVAFWIGHALSGQLDSIVAMVRTRVLALEPINSSIADFESFLALTYLMLLVAFADAYHRLMMGSEIHLKPSLRRKKPKSE